MPWRLVNKIKDTDFYLLTNKVYTVGRTASNLVVNDNSVSRKHANLFWNNGDNFIDVEDLSKFGTYINKLPLKHKKGRLYNNDVITFGAQPGIDYQCSFMSFDMMSSTLFKNDKKILTEYTIVTGDNLVDEWTDNVKYLVMSDLKVTYKVICGLIKQVNIVGINFIKEMTNYYTRVRSDFPDPDKYIPSGNSSNIEDVNIFKANIVRKTLFKNKTFYFMSNEKLLRLEEAIKSAGGQTILLSEANLNDHTLNVSLARSDSIVLHEAVSNDFVKNIYTILTQMKKRPIIDSEIGFAVLYASTDEFCNPFKLHDVQPLPETNLNHIHHNPIQINSESINEDRLKKRERNEDSSDDLQHNPKRLKSLIFTRNESNGKPIDCNHSSMVSTRNPLKIKSRINMSINKFGKENQCASNDLVVNVTRTKPMANIHSLESNHNQDGTSSTKSGNQINGPKVISTSNLEAFPDNVEGTMSFQLENTTDQESTIKRVSNAKVELLYTRSLGHQITDSVSKEAIVTSLKDKENNCGNNGLVQFMSLVKETLSKETMYKTFTKVTSVYINKNPVSMFVHK